MKKLDLFVGSLIFVFVSACDQDQLQEQVIGNYFPDSFSNLDVATLENLETP